MYINPFWAGVLFTLVVIAVLLISYGFYLNRKGKGKGGKK